LGGLIKGKLKLGFIKMQEAKPGNWNLTGA
jgi:hypothetical protein